MSARIVRRGTVSVLAVAMPAAMVALGSVPAASARLAGRPAPAPGWHVVKTIKSGGINLLDVTALPGGKAWAGGSAGSSTLSPVFYHLTGGKWVKVPRPGIGSNNVFIGDVSAGADTNVWGAVENGSAVDHWNGHTWNRISFSKTLAISIDGVLAFGTNSARVFTFNFTTMQEKVHSFIGTKSTSRVLPAEVDGDSSVNLVSASSGSNIWAWSFDPVLHHWQSLHFDGKTWTVVKVPSALIPSPAGPAQILALSPTNVWGTVVPNTASHPIILLHWNGTAWHEAAGTPPAGELLGPIASDGQGGLWLAAARALTKPPFLKPFFLHYSGGKFTTVAAPTSSLGPIFIKALAQIPGTKSVYAVGSVQSGESVIAGVIEQFRP